MNQSKKLLVLPLGAFLLLSAPAAVADETTTVIEQSGVMGVKSANVYAPKYKQRIKTYTEQIEMGAAKGWLTAEEVERFKKGLGELTTLEAGVEAKGYQKSDVDDLDKQFTKFNMEFTAAANKPAQAATPSPSAPAASSNDKAEVTGVAGVKSGGTTAGAATKTKTSTSAIKATSKGKAVTAKAKTSTKGQAKNKKP